MCGYRTCNRMLHYCMQELYRSLGALQDPTIFDAQYDFSAKHFVLAVVLPLYTQMPALHATRPNK